MTQSKATRSIIDTHRHIFGPKLRQKFVENITAIQIWVFTAFSLVP
jgi:predicted TIM-barrel fold metal-dependent hydrolase